MAVAAGWWWTGGDDEAPAPRPTVRAPADGAPALTVLGDGFALVHPDRGAHVVTRLARDGRAVAPSRVDDLGDDIRVLGVWGQPLLLWTDEDHRPWLTVVDERGRRKDLPAGDAEVVAACDGAAASSESRSVGGWLLREGWWVLYGPVEAPPRDEPAPGVATRAWCRTGARPDHNVVLHHSGRTLRLYEFRDGSRDGGLPRVIRHEIASRPAVGFGCAHEACFLATRGDGGALDVSLIDPRGKVAWTRRIDVAHDGGEVAITGAGKDRVVVAYGQRDGGERRAVAAALGRDGQARAVWRGPGGPADVAPAPAVAWSRGRLAIARRAGREVAVDVVDLP